MRFVLTVLITILTFPLQGKELVDSIRQVEHPVIPIISNQLTDSRFILSYHAQRYNSEYQYEKAESLYSYYFENYLLNPYNPCDYSDYSGLDKKVLYQYAYNCIFQGKEKKGKKLLSLAACSGYLPAVEDMSVLSTSMTFATEMGKKSLSYKTEFEQLRQKYAYLATHAQTDTIDFWQHAANENQERTKFYENLNKDPVPKTALRAVSNILGGVKLLKSYLVNLHPYSPGALEADIWELIVSDPERLYDLRIYPANECNAFATPSGEIYLTEGLVRRYHGNLPLLVSVCAHEATHYFCSHSLIAQWKQEKKQQTNTILAAIAIGLNSVLQIVGGGSSSSFQSMNNSIIDICALDAYYFEFRYGRDQEIEADISAYRFCEEIGIGGYAYIMALELLGDGTGYMRANRNSDHPTNSYRINLLKYIFHKEHGLVE